MQNNTELKVQIVESALTLAEASSWEQISLHDIALELNISLNQIRVLFAQKDDLVEAWFDHADQAMLDSCMAEDFAQLREVERIQLVIMHWFQALAKHRRLTRQMLGYKFEFGHIHLQILGIMRISRTVQWFREAARLEATGMRRIIQEVILTSIYLSCFGYWLYDKSVQSARTKRLLGKLLKRLPVS